MFCILMFLTSTILIPRYAWRGAFSCTSLETNITGIPLKVLCCIPRGASRGCDYYSPHLLILAMDTNVSLTKYIPAKFQYVQCVTRICIHMRSQGTRIPKTASITFFNQSHCHLGAAQNVQQSHTKNELWQNTASTRALFSEFHRDFVLERTKDSVAKHRDRNFRTTRLNTTTLLPTTRVHERCVQIELAPRNAETDSRNRHSKTENCTACACSARFCCEPSQSRSCPLSVGLETCTVVHRIRCLSRFRSALPSRSYTNRLHRSLSSLSSRTLHWASLSPLLSTSNVYISFSNVLPLLTLP